MRGSGAWDGAIGSLLNLGARGTPRQRAHLAASGRRPGGMFSIASKAPWMDGRSSIPFADQLPTLMRERNLTTNRLAGMVGVSQAHLWRVLRGQKTVGGDLAARTAQALGLSEDSFIETRRARLFDLLSSDAELCDRLYDELIAKPRR